MKQNNSQLLHSIAQKAGGFSALGRDFGGLSGWAVQKWYRTGVVPPERVPALIDLAARYGIPATPWQIRPDVYPVRWFTQASPPPLD